MAVTSYITIDGMMIGEITGGVMRNYGVDALGSVVETVLNGVAENNYSYKPYGSVLAKLGAAIDPSFLWNGGSGYKATMLANSEYEAFERCFSSDSAQWTTVNSRWPSDSPYAFVSAKQFLRPAFGGIKNCGTDLLTEIAAALCDSVPIQKQIAVNVCSKQMLGCECKVDGQANVTASVVVTCGKTTCAADINQLCPVVSSTVKPPCPNGPCGKPGANDMRVVVVRGTVSVDNPVNCKAKGVANYREVLLVTLVRACVPVKIKSPPPELS